MKKETRTIYLFSFVFLLMSSCLLFAKYEYLSLKVPDVDVAKNSVRGTLIVANNDNSSRSWWPNEYIYLRVGEENNNLWFYDPQLMIGDNNIFARRDIVFLKKNDKNFMGIGEWIGNGVNNGLKPGLAFFTKGNNALFINTDQRVGFGLEDPEFTLDIKSKLAYNDSAPKMDGIRIRSNQPEDAVGIYFSNIENGYLSSGIQADINYGVDEVSGLQILSARGGSIGFYTRGSQPGYSIDDTEEAMRIHGDGHVSVGTAEKANYCVMTIDGAVSIGPSGTNPEDFKNSYASDYLLWVEKGIVADDIVLAKPDDWDDEVFNEDYELRSLEEIEFFVSENKHLPEVPSETEVLEKGYRMHDMNRIFIRKIEELTLYAIEQNRAIDSLKTRLGELEKLEANRAALK